MDSLQSKLASLRLAHSKPSEQLLPVEPVVALPQKEPELPMSSIEEEEEDDTAQLLEEYDGVVHDSQVLMRVREWLYRMMNLLSQTSIPMSVKRSELSVLDRILPDYEALLADMETFRLDLEAELSSRS